MPRPKKATKRPARAKKARAGGASTAVVPAEKMSTAESLVMRNNPEGVIAELHTRRLTLDTFFAGDELSAIREAVRNTGKYTKNGRELRVETIPIPGTKDRQIVGMAAVSRDPGLSTDYVDAVQDFDVQRTPHATKIQRFWGIYHGEGVVSNAINKLAAVLSAGGNFRIRKAYKTGRGRRKMDPLDELKDVLYYWTMNVNESPEDGVATGVRGLKAVNHQGTRQALVEGDWVGRTVWTKVNIPEMGTYTLPQVIQTISTEFLEPIEELAGSGGEFFYWTPPQDLINQLRDPEDKLVKRFLDKLIPKNIQSPLLKDGKVLLDPALLLHVRHRGTDRNIFGESFIQPAMTGLAYKRSIDALDMVSMQNIINRLTIVMIGSEDPASPYSDETVAMARMALMQTFFDDPGPNMTIIWQGKDVDVKDVGAHSSVLELDDRHRIGEGKVKISLGVPEALLTGGSTDSKAAGWAAAAGASALMEELQNHFAQVWTTLGKRIATQNGFVDVDLIYEFEQGLMVDQTETKNQTRLDYNTGVISIHTVLEARGIDPQAEFRIKAEEKGLDPDDENLTWEEVFSPPQGMPGQAVTDGPGGSRPSTDETGKPDEGNPPENKTTEEQS